MSTILIAAHQTGKYPKSLDASEATSGAYDSDQYIFLHDCTLEAMRTQGVSTAPQKLD